MATQPWLDEVRRQLTEKRLPPSYIRRFMDELADHLEDLKEETMSKNENSLAQLGKPDDIAEAATVAYRQRTFFGRHPVAKFLVFGLSPIFSMVLAFALISFGLLGIGSLCEHFGVRLADKTYLGDLQPWLISWGLSIMTTILPASALTLLYCHFAKRSKLSKRWTLTSICLLAFFAMCFFQSMTFSDLPGKSQFSAGLGFSLSPTLLQWVQLLVPLAVGLWFMRHTREKPSDLDKEKSLSAAA